jgi:hypothetical protein
MFTHISVVLGMMMSTLVAPPAFGGRLARVQNEGENETEETERLDHAKGDEHGGLQAAGHLRLAGHGLDRLGADDGQTDGGADASETERERSTQSFHIFLLVVPTRGSVPERVALSIHIRRIATLETFLDAASRRSVHGCQTRQPLPP